MAGTMPRMIPIRLRMMVAIARPLGSIWRWISPAWRLSPTMLISGSAPATPINPSRYAIRLTTTAKVSLEMILRRKTLALCIPSAGDSFGPLGVDEGGGFPHKGCPILFVPLFLFGRSELGPTAL
jgi:hypothetical protein